MRRTLVAGFGNIYRRDDGAARAVVDVLRRRLGRPALTSEEDGFDDRGHEIDTVLLHQLVPELATDVADYDLVIFIDAHVGSLPEDLREEALEACYKPATVSHQLHPCTVLALAHELHQRAPQGVLLSLRGHDFDFGEGLSAETAAIVPGAVERILHLAQAGA
jgi:hydrogenase maturation protease